MAKNQQEINETNKKYKNTQKKKSTKKSNVDNTKNWQFNKIITGKKEK